MPPALTNLLDHFLEEYFWRPSGIVSYSAGMFGGVRAAVQLRAPLCEMGMPSIPSLLPIPRVQTAFDEAGVPVDPEGMARRFNRFATELEWYAEALREQRKRGVPY
jgi:NAD(P)H-dependent FMN reductase